MKLSDLDSKNLSLDVLLLQTSSLKLMMFLQDKVKRRFKIKSEAIINVETKTDLKKVKEVIGTTPPFSDRWYVEINLDKLYDKELVKLIRQSNTCIFFCTSTKYGNFKKFKEEMKDLTGFKDLYINYLKRSDFIYLYDAFVLSDNKLTKQLFDYVVQSYSSDIESVFDLLLALNQGTKFESRKAIADVCGLGGLSIESYIFSLIKPISGSDKGLKTVLKNRITAGVDLGNTLGYSKMYNFMSKSLFCFCEIKMLMMSGVVYKAIRNLPDSFDEKSLVRYQRYLWRLKETPMTSLLRLRQSMGDRVWRSEEDFLNFVYRYYEYEASNLLKLRNNVRNT